MQISKTDTGGIVKWDSDDFSSGLIPQGSSGNNTYPLKYNGINGFSTAYNVDQDVLNGCLAQGYAPNTNATNSSSVRGNIVSANAINNGQSYGIDTGGYVHAISNIGATVTISTTSPFPVTPAYATGSGSYYLGQDTILYRHNYSSAVVSSMFYTMYRRTNAATNIQSGTVWGVGILTNNFSLAEPQFLNNASVGNYLNFITDSTATDQIFFPHPMEIGADAILYIGSGRYVHAYDGSVGTHGTYYSKVLTLPVGSVVVGMRKFNDKLLIAVNFDPAIYISGGASTAINSVAAFVYTWNYLDLDVTSVIDTEEVEISAITVWKGGPVFVAFGVAEANGRNKLKTISGNTVLTLASFDGGLPTNRGIITSTTAFYMNCPTGLYRVGSRFKDGYMISRYGSRNAAAVEPGVFLLGDNSSSMFASGSTSTVANGTGTCYYSSNINSFDAAYCKFPNLGNLFPGGKKGRIKYIEVEYQAPIAGSGGMTLKLSTDTNTVITTVLSNVTTVTGNLIKRYTRDSSNNVLPTFSNFDISVEWLAGSGPIIARMEAEYELLEVTN